MSEPITQGPVTALDSSPEKRRLDRMRARWRVLVLLQNGDKIPCYTSDISEGGLGLLSRQAFALKSLLNIAVFIPNPRDPGKFVVLSLSGRVVFQVMRNDEMHTGLQFEQLSENAQKTIYSAMQALSAR